MATTPESISLKNLKRQRASVKAQVTRISSYVNETTQLNAFELDGRKNRLDDLFKSYDTIQNSIEAEDELADHFSERANFENQFFATQALVCSNIKALQVPDSASPSIRSSESPSVVKQAHTLLPKIAIPSFDGNPIEWHSFHDTFKSLVHENEELPAVQKFHYLKNALRGEVTSIIASLNATGQNYIVAWELLQKRCNKPRQIIQAHLKLLFELPEISKDLPVNLRNLAEQAQVHINALNSLKLPTEHWDAILIYLLSKKLDKITRRAWERTLENEEIPTFEQFLNFIHKQARGEEIDIEQMGTSNSNNYDTRVRGKFIKRGQAYLATNNNIKVSTCASCNETHEIYTCPQFLKLSIRDRIEAARKGKLCLNCLRNGHSTNFCTRTNCRKCNRKHNTLLHINTVKQNNPSTSIEASSDRAQNSEIVKTTLLARGEPEVLLGTAQITILDRFNNSHTCRVLLDGGSQSHYITDRLATILQLDKHNIHMTTTGLSNLITRAKCCVNTTIKSKDNSFTSKVKFIVLPTITGFLPSQQIDRSSLKIPRNINLADPEFYKPGEVDGLLGNTLFFKLLSVGQINLHHDRVVLQKSRLGWLVTGEADLQAPLSSKVRNTSCFLSTSLDKQVAKFWEIEEIPKQTILSAEEAACEEHFVSNTTRASNGRYIVRLPFNDHKQLLGSSRNSALKRFYSMERKLHQDAVLFKYYKEFLDEYKSLNHMSEVSDDNIDEGFYLPHHAVIKTSSATTKLRVVFDASAKSSSGVSLNDALRVGPTIQGTLFSTLLRFRSHIIVLTADIEKMFRQIQVHADDTCYQKILWRDSRDQPIKTYRLNTVTYGTASAPFLAIRCLKQLADDERERFTLAATAFNRDFYVDDILTGAPDYQSALKLRDELIGLAKVGGFHLRQWMSNDINLIKDLNVQGDEKSLCLDFADTKKTLGISWNPASDTIVYRFHQINKQERITKRVILSQIAQLFDPLGLLGPIIIKAKIIMQQLWKLTIGWDEVVPQSIYNSWLQFKGELPLLNNFTTTRKILRENTIEFQLHGFCDASESAFGACIFIRVTDEHKLHHVTLLCAKSRVAPLKTQSLPRLELCAAKLLANLFVETVVSISHIKFNKVRFWSDSTITLQWIKTSPHLLKTFVANRVNEIQQLTNSDNWFHVPTTENPADFISRGQTPSQFIQNTTWLSGPVWLSREENAWPAGKLPLVEIPEKRNLVCLVTSHDSNSLFNRFSSLRLLNRVVAYILRFRNNTRGSEQIRGPLTVKEIQEAHLRIIKLVQTEAFTQDINRLKNGKVPSKEGKIQNLSPFLDDEGLLRVGGRLKNAPIRYAQKHPILLPRSHHVTNLIIQQEHIRQLHSGVQATLNALRQNYWPINGRNTIKQIIHKCIRCYRANPKAPTYLMGNLPINRVTKARPFQNVGIDYCGPFFIKEKKERNRSKVKVYVSVFVCFVTKAMHLELVTDLTMETCLGAIKRFLARRGRPKNIYSDNGTNFVGTKNELMKLQTFTSSDEYNNGIQGFLTNESINWHFSPPRSPHFGGLWEAAVKSFKRHLVRTISDSLVTYEQFNTLILEIEAILNSRPLIPLSSDPNDLIALTPAHFLIGDTLHNLPEHDLTEVAQNKLSVWQHIQQLKQHFWRRWHKEYLHELHTRNKWHLESNSQIKIGTLVTLQDENTPPMQWKLGRIIALHPGKDNVIRVATVRTTQGSYKRSINKLSPLPIDELPTEE